MDVTKIQDAISVLLNASLITHDLEKFEFTQKVFKGLITATDDPELIRASKFYADVFGLMIELNKEIPRAAEQDLRGI